MMTTVLLSSFYLLLLLLYLDVKLGVGADLNTDDIGPLSPEEEALLTEYRKNQSALIAATSAIVHPKTGFMYQGMNLCSLHDIFNGSWVFEGEEKSDYGPCPKTLQLSKDIDEASYVCEKYRKAEFNRDNGCRVLSYKALIPVLEKEFGHHPNKKDLYFIGDSLGTQQYLAANCDFEIEKSNIDIKFIGEATFLPDVPCDIRCRDDGHVFLRHWAKVHPRLCMACPEETHMGWPTIYTKENATDSWMKKLDLDKAAAVIMNGGVWYNWLHGYGKFPDKSFDSSSVYIKMLDHITPAMKKIVDYGVKLFWIGIPTIPQNDGNRKRRGIDWAFYSSKNELAKKAVEGVGGSFIDIASSTEARKNADELITIDGYHWCNPGPTSVTSYINQAILHLLALDILKSNARRDIIDTSNS